MQTATATILYNNGVSGQNSTRALSGTGAAPASLAISDGPIYDYGDVATGGFADKALTITNSGGVPATGLNGSGLSTPFAFKGGGFPGTGGTCTSSLAASATCTVVITYSPVANGVATNTVTINYFNGAASDSTTRGLQGNGVTPALLTISDGPTYDYGSIPNTGSAEKIFTVTNGGNFNATAMNGSGLTAPFSYKGGTYPGTGGTCGASLAPVGTCTIVVVFNPTAVGSFSSSANVGYFNGASSQTASRAVQGVGAPPGALSISDGPTFNFGSWPNGDTREKTFTVTNTGGVPTTAITGGGLAAPFTFKGGTYPGTGATCGISLNPSATCTIIVQYSPTVLGSASDSIELNYNDGLIGQVSTRDVIGTAVPPAQLSISDGATYDYGTVAVGGSREKTFTVTNTGGFSAGSVAGSGLTSPYSFKGGTYPGTGGTCSTSLNVSASCTIVVTYAPIGTGVQSGTITMSYNDGVAPQNATRAITGTGAAPALLTLSDGPTYNYPSVPTGSSAEKTFTLTNAGGVSATAVSGGGLSAPFTFKGGSYPGTGGLAV